MLCEGDGGTVETFYFADLPAVAHWAIEGDALTLSADDGQPVLAFAVQPAPSPDGHLGRHQLRRWRPATWCRSTTAA